MGANSEGKPTLGQGCAAWGAEGDASPPMGTARSPAPVTTVAASTLAVIIMFASSLFIRYTLWKEFSDNSV
jgi:hypothetical protein